MGSEGSTRAELDIEKTRVREKTPEVLTSSKPAGSKEKGPATLGCASAGAGVCRCGCRCCHLRGNAEDLVVNQALDGIP